MAIGLAHGTLDMQRPELYFVRRADKGVVLGAFQQTGGDPVMLLHELRSGLVAVLFLALPLIGCGAGGQASDSLRAFPLGQEDLVAAGAICYGPHRDGQWPGGPVPTAAQIREDLLTLGPHWRVLRLYGSSEFAGLVLEAIRSAGLDMRVILGVWIAPDEKRGEQGAAPESDAEAAAANQREIDSAVALAAAFPDIVLAVCVGNETQVSWSSNRVPLDALVGHIRRVRAAVAVPVTTADDYQYWREPDSRALAREIDFITLHVHPLWNGRQLDDALPWLREQLAAVQSVHPERLLVIGETGWATSRSGQGEQARLMKGATGEAEQAVFYAAVRHWAAAESVITFFFEAFDENWKGGSDPDDAEKHWGFFRADRTPKASVR